MGREGERETPTNYSCCPKFILTNFPWRTSTVRKQVSRNAAAESKPWGINTQFHFHS